MASLDMTRVTRRSDAEHLLEAAIPDAGMRLFVLQNLASTAQGFAWRINLQAIENSLPALLDFPVDALARPFTGPTLFLRGALSDYVLEHDEPVIRRLFPSVDIVTIEGAGHWVHAEQPARFLEALGGT
jgi:pimeloyl-ACP methyl ester carboxylesterase